MGVEPTATDEFSAENSQISAAGGAKAALALCLPISADADLRAVVEAWPTLPDPIKAGISAMVRAATRS